MPIRPDSQRARGPASAPPRPRVPRRRRLGPLLGAALLCVLSAALPACGPEPETADLVLLNGRVWTANPEQPWAEAVSVKGNTILAAGTTRDVEAQAGARTRKIDLGGRLVVPGLNDAHIHFLSGSLAMEQVHLDDARDLAEMKRLVKEWADAHPDAPWVVGRGWVYSRFPGGLLPTRRELDAVVPDRPVCLEAYDGHTTWVNSWALAAAGIDRSTKFDGFGEIVRDPRSGEPTGILKESAGDLVWKVLPKPSQEEKLAALGRGLAEARRLGLTAILNATGDPDEFTVYDRLLKSGALTLRTALAMVVDRNTTDADVERYLELARTYNGPMLRGGYAKMFADGVIESHTAAMLEPYSDDPRSSGASNFTPQEMTGWVKKLDAAGLEVLVHAIGDRGVRMTLDAFQTARAENPPRPRRPRIEHIETIAAQDIPRFKELEVVASMQPLHGAPDPEGVWARNVGRQRLSRAFAWRALRDAGARLAHGSDWPVVTLNPFHGIYTAVTRGYLDGRPEPAWAPEQRETLEQALAGYTIDAAYAASEEKVRGSIEPGKLADLAVLSQDLFSVPAEKIPQTESLLTLVDGKVVHEAEPFRVAAQ